MNVPARFGRYELLETIGQGSLGTLYRGHDTLLGRAVAIKLMAAGFQGDAAAQARFFSEARAAARLQHVNIVTMFEFGEQDDTAYIVMEFLNGSNLADWLDVHPSLPLAEKLDIGIQLCAGLDAAHRQGVVHRDVKPGNIWVCDDGTVKLLDFGIGSATASDATIADALGSPAYMSPEQVTGKQVDARTDIFSAGAVLYEVVTGRLPFEADSPTAIMLKIMNEAARPIADDELPPALKAAVARALEKAPEDRYPHASDFGRALRAVKANLPNPREAPTVLLDRSSVDLAPAIPAPPAATESLDTAEPEGSPWRPALLIVALVLAVAASAGIGWCAFRPASTAAASISGTAAPTSSR